jgi:hypothetical protein
MAMRSARPVHGDPGARVAERAQQGQRVIADGVVGGHGPGDVVRVLVRPAGPAPPAGLRGEPADRILEPADREITGFRRGHARHHDRAPARPSSLPGQRVALKCGFWFPKRLTDG